MSYCHIYTASIIFICGRVFWVFRYLLIYFKKNTHTHTQYFGLVLKFTLEHKQTFFSSFWLSLDLKREKEWNACLLLESVVCFHLFERKKNLRRFIFIFVISVWLEIYIIYWELNVFFPHKLHCLMFWVFFTMIIIRLDIHSSFFFFFFFFYADIHSSILSDLNKK